MPALFESSGAQHRKKYNSPVPVPGTNIHKPLEWEMGGNLHKGSTQHPSQFPCSLSPAFD